MQQTVNYIIPDNIDNQEILRQIDAKDKELFDEFQKFKSVSQLLESNKYVLGLNASSIDDEQLMLAFDQIDQLDAPKLYSLVVGCCIELHAYQIFKNFYSEALDRGKEWSALSKKGSQIITVDYKTSAGIAFYFRFLGQYDPGETVSVFSADKINVLKKAMESENSEIRELSTTLYRCHKGKFLREKAVNTIFEFGNLLNPLTEEIRLNASTQGHVRGFSSLINALNFTNQLLKREFQDLIPEYEASWALELPPEKQEEILEILSKANEDVKNRVTQFLKIQTRLTKLREEQQKGRRLEFTRQYMQHSYPFLTVQIQNYQKIHQECFSIPDVSSKKKERIAAVKTKKNKSSAGTKKKPALKKNQIPKKQPPKASSGRPKAKPTPPASPSKIKPMPKREATKEVKAPIVISKKANFYAGYAERVAEWFQEVPAHLETESYRNLSAAAQAKHIARHAFPSEVEDFVEEYGFEKSYSNSLTGHADRLFCIPGEIHFYEDQEKIVERGVFNFCVGKDGKMYHRHFSKREDTEIFECANDAFYHYDYPSLQESQAASMSKGISRSKKILLNSEIKIEKDELTEAIKIRDFNRKATYVLFKTGSL